MLLENLESYEASVGKLRDMLKRPELHVEIEEQRKEEEKNNR